jgi:hypothetical protein
MARKKVGPCARRGRPGPPRWALCVVWTIGRNGIAPHGPRSPAARARRARLGLCARPASAHALPVHRRGPRPRPRARARAGARVHRQAAAARCDEARRRRGAAHQRRPGERTSRLAGRSRAFDLNASRLAGRPAPSGAAAAAPQGAETLAGGGPRRAVRQGRRRGTGAVAMPASRRCLSLEVCSPPTCARACRPGRLRR